MIFPPYRNLYLFVIFDMFSHGGDYDGRKKVFQYVKSKIFQLIVAEALLGASCRTVCITWRRTDNLDSNSERALPNYSNRPEFM